MDVDGDKTYGMPPDWGSIPQLSTNYASRR